LGKDKGKKFSVNGRLSFDMKIFDNEALDRRANSRSTITPEARVDLSYRPSKNVEAFASFKLGTEFDRRNGRWNTTGTVEVREAYLLIDNSIAKHVEFQIGRQQFKDKRRWLYNERLDAVRLAYDHKAWRVEIAYGREALLPKDVFRGDPGRDKVDNYLFHAQYEVNRDWDVSVYALKQNDRRASNVSPLLIGVQSDGRISPSFGHWFEFSRERGKVGTRKLRATAVDAGLIYFLPVKAKPAIFAGYARGSGGGDATTTRNFRQTSLQDNEDRITGLGNVHYYGELLDPDLSNIAIYTLGAGLRPSRASSLEIVGHKYRQVKLDNNDVRGSPVAPDLNGISRKIGTEIDVIFAHRLGGGFGLEAKMGRFRPGKGYDLTARDNAYYGKIRLVYRF
jgi:alginate production protein